MHLKPVCRQKVNKDSVGLLYTAAILAVSIAPSREGGGRMGGLSQTCHRSVR